MSGGQPSNSNKMPFLPPSRHPPTANWHDNLSQVNDNPALRLPMPHGVNTTISQQPPLPSSMNSIAPAGAGSMNSGNSNFMIGQDGDNSIRMNVAIKNDQRIPGLSNNIMAHSDNRGLHQGNLGPFAKQSYPGLEHFKVPAAVAETALKVQQSQQRLGRDNNCIPETVAIYALSLSGTNIPGTNKPKRVVINDNEMRTSIEQGELYTKHESVVIGILTNQVHVPGFNIADYLTREKFLPHEMENIENIHSRIDPYQLICLMEFIRYRYPPELRHKIQTSEHNRTHLPHQSMDPSDFRSSLNQRDMITNTQHLTTSRNSNAAFSPMPVRLEAGLSPYDKSRRASQSPSDTTRSQINISAPRPQAGHHLTGVPSYPSPSHPITSLAGNSRMNSLYYTPLTREQKLSLSTPQTLPLLKVSSPFQPPLSVGGSQPLSRPASSHPAIGGLGLGPYDGPPAINVSTQIRQPPAAHQSSCRPNIPGALDMSPTPAHSFNAPVAAHLSSKTPQTPKLQENPVKSTIKGSPYVSNSFLNKPSNNSQLPVLSHLDQLGSPTKQADVESANGLPMRAILRQHELANRELALRRSITPHFTTQGIVGHPGHPNMLGPRGVEMPRLDLGPRSPSQMQFAHLNSQDFYRLPSGPNSLSMPPPHVRPYDSNKLSNFSTTQSTIANGDAHLKQYPTMMPPYQQQHPNLLSNKSPDNTNSLAVSQQPSPSQVYYPGLAGPPGSSDHSQFDIQQQHHHNQQQQQPPAISPKQRSIITGSASASAKKGKKSKLSPPIYAQSATENKGANLGISSVETAQRDSEKQVLGCSPVTLNNSHNVSPSQDQHSPNDNNNQLCKLAAAAVAAPAVDVHQLTTDASDPAVTAPHGTSSASPLLTGNITNARDDENNLTILKNDSTVGSSDNRTNSEIDIRLHEDKNGRASSLTNNTSACVGSKIGNQSSEPTPEPSKYQKLFTKKAWLKIYDQEDQAKISENTTYENITPNTTIKTEKEVNETIKTSDTKEETKLNQPANKTNDNTKGSKASKIDTKKKAKANRGKSSSLSSLKNSRATNNKSVENYSENDSEETASTSELDETTDEADSMKTTGDNKVRRMPRRKVKINPHREPNQTNSSAKSKSLKDANRRRVNRDKSTVNTGENESTPTNVIKRKYNSDDEGVKQSAKKLKDNNGNSWEQAAETPSKNRKRTGEKFLQTCPCYDIVPKNIRCMECRRVRQSSLKGDKAVPSKQTSRTNWDDFCRFYEFRKLRYNKSDQIIVAGFSEMSDARDSDKKLWLPNATEIPSNFNYNIAKFILTNVGSEFCNLVLQERAVQVEYQSKSGDKRITWKRAVNGLRELCDVCSTTLFNCHFVCERCGFVVCIDCHHHRARQQLRIDEQEEDLDIKKENSPSAVNENSEEQAINIPSKKSKKDSSGWIYCAKNEEHSADKMILARIVAGDCLEEVWTFLHETRTKLNLGPCPCKPKSVGNTNNTLEHVTSTGEHAMEAGNSSQSTLKGLLLTSASPRGCQTTENESSDIKPNDDSKAILNKKTGEKNYQDSKVFDFGNEDESQDDSKQVSAAIEECIASLSAKSTDDNCDIELKSDQPDLPPMVSSKSIWTTLCEGNLLVLNQPKHKQNLHLFRQHWRMSKPVLVRGVDKLMNVDLWLPQFFAVQFGDYRSDLVDCRNGDIHRQSMKKYWDGFESNVSARKKNKDDMTPSHIPLASNEEPSAITTTYYCGSALWRLKDWPPGQDFNEILPDHYNDFMNNLPLKSYTTRTGKLNLACRLPKETLKPDLGPKMYSAYGTTKFPERGTTNLHLDISDAINVMVYVGGATSLKNGSVEMREMFDKTINEAQVDDAMKSQIRQEALIPGALWHIFKPSDASKVREFLNKVADERKISPEKRTDPIHDQIWYLDQNLLNRLHKEYGVLSYPILQCMGDAILIPAGAPHQVKNLQNCIKVANDFVSPENVHWCLKLTDEFRKLPETHINQEDKLQIKNILYHSVKESLQFIKMSDLGKVTHADSETDSDRCNETDADRTESDSDSNDNHMEAVETRETA